MWPRNTQMNIQIPRAFQYLVQLQINVSCAKIKVQYYLNFQKLTIITKSYV